MYRLNPKSPFSCVLLTTNKFNGLLYLTSPCAQWIDTFSVCQISASLLGQWPVLMSAINLWMQHYSIIPPTWARSRDLAWSGLSGLHPRKFHYHNINTSRCQDLYGFLFTLLLRSLFPSLISYKSPRPSRARGCLARSERWILHETSLDLGVEHWAGVQGS